MKVIDKFQSLNSARNRYVHGVYCESEGHVGQIDCTDPSFEAVYAVGAVRLLNGAELKNHVEAVTRLQLRALRCVKRFPPQPAELVS